MWGYQKQWEKKQGKEFASAVKGDHPDTKSFRRYVMAQLRCAAARARLYVVEIDTIAEELKRGSVDAEKALEMMGEAGTLDFLMLVEPNDATEEKR